VDNEPTNRDGWDERPSLDNLRRGKTPTAGHTKYICVFFVHHLPLQFLLGRPFRKVKTMLATKRPTMIESAIVSIEKPNWMPDTISLSIRDFTPRTPTAPGTRTRMPDKKKQLQCHIFGRKNQANGLVPALMGMSGLWPVMRACRLPTTPDTKAEAAVHIWGRIP